MTPCPYGSSFCLLSVRCILSFLGTEQSCASFPISTQAARAPQGRVTYPPPLPPHRVHPISQNPLGLGMFENIFIAQEKVFWVWVSGGNHPSFSPWLFWASPYLAWVMFTREALESYQERPWDLNGSHKAQSRCIFVSLAWWVLPRSTDQLYASLNVQEMK